MKLIYDNPALAALTLTRLAADESEAPGGLEGRMLDYLDGLERRNGTAYLELVAITLPGSTSNLWTTWPGPPGHTRGPSRHRRTCVLSVRLYTSGSQVWVSV